MVTLPPQILMKTGIFAKCDPTTLYLPFSVNQTNGSRDMPPQNFRFSVKMGHLPIYNPNYLMTSEQICLFHPKLKFSGDSAWNDP